MSGVNYYQLLGINTKATDVEIRKAYLRLSLLYHPDKRRTPDAHADELYRRIQEAYATLSCPEKRCFYDFLGCCAALADATSSHTVGLSSSLDSGLQHRSAFPLNSSGAAWMQGSSGGTLHSWGSSSAPSRQSPCVLYDTMRNPSPGAATGSFSSSQSHKHRSSLSVQLKRSDSPTATCGSSSGGRSVAGAPSTSCRSSAADLHDVAAATDATEPLLPRPSCPADHQRPPLPPQPKLQVSCQLPATPPPTIPSTDSISITATLDPNTNAPSAAAAVEASSDFLTPVASPSTLLGKRRAPGDDDTHGPTSKAQPNLSPSPRPPLHSPMHSSKLNLMNGTSMGTSPSDVGRRVHCADVQHRLLLTLEEMYSGCVKQLRLTRRVYRPPPVATVGDLSVCCSGSSSCSPGSNQHPQSLPDAVGNAPHTDAPPPTHAAIGDNCPVEELFRVVVQPGWREGTKLTFPGKGDELPCGSRGDMVLVVAQTSHGRYERRGNDLHTVVVVPLVAALTGADTSLTTLDGRTLMLQLGPDCLQPFSVFVIKGEGMPIPLGGKSARAGGAAAAATDPSAAVAAPRGDLHVRFDVSFPSELTAEQKTELRRALLQQ